MTLELAGTLHQKYKNKDWYKCICFNERSIVLVCREYPYREKIPFQIDGLFIGIMREIKDAS